MPIVKIDNQNFLSALKHDDGRPFVMARTNLKHYHNDIQISTHFRTDGDNVEEVGELLSVFKFNRQNEITKHMIISC